MPEVSVAEQLMAIEERLAMDLLKLGYGSLVEYVYNPIDHAKEPHFDFLQKYYSHGTRDVMFLGMNPGPWGMIQTGVPFGEVEVVREFLKVSGNVTSPTKQHPKRKVEGLNCTRREVSGQRFWNFFRRTCESPENFTSKCFVYSLCPLSFMTSSGKNVPLNDLKIGVRKQLLKICGEYLLEVLDLMKTSTVICLGRFVESHAKKIITSNSIRASVHFLVHPSPASPVANSGWEKIATNTLKDIGLYDQLVAKV